MNKKIYLLYECKRCKREMEVDLEKYYSNSQIVEVYSTYQQWVAVMSLAQILEDITECAKIHNCEHEGYMGIAELTGIKELPGDNLQDRGE